MSHQSVKSQLSKLCRNQLGIAHLGLILVVVSVAGIIGLGAYSVLNKPNPNNTLQSIAATETVQKELALQGLFKSSADAAKFADLIKHANLDNVQDANDLLEKNPKIKALFKLDGERNGTPNAVIITSALNEQLFASGALKTANKSKLSDRDKKLQDGLNKKTVSDNSGGAANNNSKTTPTNQCKEAYRVYDIKSKQCVRDCAYSQTDDAQYYWTDNPDGKNTCVKQKDCPGGNIVKGINEHRCYRNNSVRYDAGATNEAAKAKCAELGRVYDGKNGCKRQCVNEGWYLQNKLSGWDECFDSKDGCNLGDGWAKGEGFTVNTNDNGKKFYKCYVELSTPGAEAKKPGGGSTVAQEVTCPTAIKILEAQGLGKYDCGDKDNYGHVNCNNGVGGKRYPEAKWSERRAIFQDASGKKYLSRDKICLTGKDGDNADDKDKKPEEVKCNSKNFNGKSHAKKAYEYLGSSDKKKYKCMGLNSSLKNLEIYVKLPDGNTYKMIGLISAADNSTYWKDFCLGMHRDYVPDGYGCAAFGADNRGCNKGYIAGNTRHQAKDGTTWRGCIKPSAGPIQGNPGINWERFCKSINRPAAKNGCGDGCSPKSYKVTEKRYNPYQGYKGTGWRGCEKGKNENGGKKVSDSQCGVTNSKPGYTSGYYCGNLRTSGKCKGTVEFKGKNRELKWEYPYKNGKKASFHICNIVGA